MFFFFFFYFPFGFLPFWFYHSWCSLIHNAILPIREGLLRVFWWEVWCDFMIIIMPANALTGQSQAITRVPMLPGIARKGESHVQFFSESL